MHTFMATGDNAQARLVESWWGRITMVGLTTLDVELAPLKEMADEVICGVCDDVRVGWKW